MQRKYNSVERLPKLGVWKNIRANQRIDSKQSQHKISPDKHRMSDRGSNNSAFEIEVTRPEIEIEVIASTRT